MKSTAPTPNPIVPPPNPIVPTAPQPASRPALVELVRDLLDDGLHAQAPDGVHAVRRAKLFAARRRALDKVPGSLGRIHPEGHLNGQELAYPARFSGAADARLDLPPSGFSWFERARARWTAPDATSPDEPRWPRRLGFAVLVVLALALQFTAEEAELRQSQREGDTDAQLLTGELPLEAYSDRGFAVFLRNMLINRADQEDDSSAAQGEEEDAEAQDAEETGGEIEADAEATLTSSPPPAGHTLPSTTGPASSIRQGAGRESR